MSGDQALDGVDLLLVSRAVDALDEWMATHPGADPMDLHVMAAVFVAEVVAPNVTAPAVAARALGLSR